jgi:hypothetical protein
VRQWRGSTHGGKLALPWLRKLEVALKKYLFTVLAALAAASAAAPAWSAVDVGVGITIREPGVYGRIEIGSQPPPPLLYPQAVIIAAPAVVVQPPLYLYVPPGHAKNWGKHCGQYNACARHVYFVQESWVQTRYDEQHSKGKSKNKGKGNKHDD